jgi:hypothetical protein
MPSVKELYKKLSDVKIDANSVNLNTDGLESLLATTQADIALIKADLADGAYVNAVETVNQIKDGDGSVFGLDRSFPIDGNVNIQSSIPAGTNLIGSVTVTAIGATTDTVAINDTGTFSIIALIKRGLQNWTSLLAKIPALVSGRIPVDGSGVTQPVSIALSTTPAVTTFTSITSATLIASNASRKMLTIQNTGAGILYVLFGTGTASSTNFSLQMNSGDFYENNYYNGQMNAIFATAGTAYVTSLT